MGIEYQAQLCTRHPEHRVATINSGGECGVGTVILEYFARMNSNPGTWNIVWGDILASVMYLIVAEGHKLRVLEQ